MRMGIDSFHIDINRVWPLLTANTILSLQGMLCTMTLILSEVTASHAYSRGSRTWATVIGGLPIPESKAHGANMGPTRGRQDPGGPFVGHVKLAI